MSPYTNVTKRFIRKIKKDKEFFSYANSTDEEIVVIINQRSLDLLCDSLDELQPMIAIEQNVNFLNKDDENVTFSFDLISTEEDLISDLMVVKYFEEELIKLKAMQKYLGNDIKVFSPNAERRTFLDMVKYKHTQFEAKLSNYNSINRNTGKFLMAY